MKFVCAALFAALAALAVPAALCLDEIAEERGGVICCMAMAVCNADSDFPVYGDRPCSQGELEAETCIANHICCSTVYCRTHLDSGTAVSMVPAAVALAGLGFVLQQL
jgi:hypothetical protein